MFTFTIYDLISDAKLALKSGAYFSALSLTFAIISECASIEYPDEWFDNNANNDPYLIKNFPSHYKNGKYSCKNHDRERFQMWVDDISNDHNCEEKIKQQMKDFADYCEEDRKTDYGLLPEENGELLYQIRCSLFHEGSTNIDFSNSNKISDLGNSKIVPQDFLFTIDKNDPYPMHERYICSVSSSGQATMNININGFVDFYLQIVENYCKKNADKNFNTINVFDNRSSKN